MTPLEALCVINNGWRTEEQRAVYVNALDLIAKEAARVHRAEQIKMLESKLGLLKGDV